MDASTKKYKAVFEAPALVRIEIEVDGENQQQGLINAHDLVHLVKANQATVLSIALDQAVNVAFDPVVETAATPAELPFKVRFYNNPDTTEPVARQVGAETFEDAKQLAESVRSQHSRYAMATVAGELGYTTLQIQAPRGGYEVHVLFKDENCAPEIHSWLRTLAEQKALMAKLFARKDSAAQGIQLINFTDREAGPQLMREIRW